MDRVSSRGLIQRELVPRAGELVCSVLNPVRPRDEYLPAPNACHLVSGVAVEWVAAPDRIGAESRADFDDHSSLIART
jgi:hypothetical protein